VAAFSRPRAASRFLRPCFTFVAILFGVSSRMFPRTRNAWDEHYWVHSRWQVAMCLVTLLTLCDAYEQQLCGQQCISERKGTTGGTSYGRAELLRGDLRSTAPKEGSRDGQMSIHQKEFRLKKKLWVKYENPYGLRNVPIFPKKRPTYSFHTRVLAANLIPACSHTRNSLLAFTLIVLLQLPREGEGQKTRRHTREHIYSGE